jgi:DtxR family Mn-dependent transcriptional regulator
MYSHAVEDYLKAIYLLQERDGIAKTGALARQLGITAGSVTEMLKRMAGMSPPLITYRHHHGVSLTDRGQREAMGIIRRHRLLETFLHQVLGFGWEAVHEEADALEHHISERLVQAIDGHLEHPRCDPHGEPIPDASGRMIAPDGQKLSSLEKGTPFRIVRVDPSLDGILDHLDQMELGLETTGVVIDQAPFDGPISLRLSGAGGHRETVIGREVANHIYVVAP